MPVIGYKVPTLAVNYVVPAPVIEYVSSALVIEYIAPAPAASAAVELSALHVVDSLDPLEEFDAPVYNQVHQEQVVTGRYR